MDTRKSEVITVTSCSPPSQRPCKSKEQKKTSRKCVRFHSHNKWSSIAEVNGTSTRYQGGNRIWRFKHIALPWLPKPSKRTATERKRRQNQTKIMTSQGSRVLRTNSAPKSLRTEFRERQSIKKTHNTFLIDNCDGIDKKHKRAEKEDKLSIVSPLDQCKRRISLPEFATDVTRFRERAVLGEQLKEQCCLTPNLWGKVVTTKETEDDLFSAKTNGKWNKDRKFSSNELDTNGKKGLEIRKPRSHSFELPNVQKMSLDERDNSVITNRLTQNVPDKNLFLPPRQLLQVKEDPVALFVSNQDFENFDSKHFNEGSKSEARLSRSEPSLAHLSHPDIRQPADILPFNITIREILQAELQAQLEMRTFCVELCQDWCKNISQAVKQKIQDLRSDPYKIVCVVYIGALRGHGVHASIQSLWSPHQDNFTAVSYKNSSLFAVATALAVKFE